MTVELENVGGQPMAMLVNGQRFCCDEETGETIIPRKFLTGFRLSEIPPDVMIKPVECIKNNVIHVENNFTLSRYTNGEGAALVEEMFRRKFWDGEVGLTPYVAALRQAIAETADVAESDLDDDGDYIFLHYEISFRQDLDVQHAMQRVDAAISAIHERADQLVNRRRDGLLGIFDRGSFESDMDNALRRPKVGLALVMLDIDRFKELNDTHGHRMGDAALQAVARVLSDLCPPGAVCYRYGGEELAVILLGANLDDAMRFAESARAHVGALVFDERADLTVTASLGVAVASEGGTVEELVSRADAALYKAKYEGRNCVRVGE